jgi:hypothetical protein
MKTNIDKKQVAYIFDITTTHSSRLGIETVEDVRKEVTQRQRESLKAIRSTWVRFQQVLALLHPNGRVATPEETAEDYAWSAGWDGESPLIKWVADRQLELDKLKAMLSVKSNTS